MSFKRFSSILFFGAFFFASVGFSANQCVELFDSSVGPAISSSSLTEPVLDADALSEKIDLQSEALKKIARQHLLQNAIHFLQTRVTVSSFRSTSAIEERNRLNLIHFLSSGKHEEAIDIYRDKFEAVELAYWMIKQDRDTLRQLETQSFFSPIALKDKAEVNFRLKIFERRFARNYGEYMKIRHYLEKVIQDAKVSPLFLQAAKTTLQQLGVHRFSKIHSDFASLQIPEERPSATDIETLFKSSSKFTRLKLWSDFKNEIISVMKFAISAEVLVGAVDKVFNKLPANLSFKLKSFTGLMRSAKLRNRYLPLIVEIESLPEDMTLRLEDLRRKNTTTPNDELLITYARTVDFSDSWNALKEEAKRKSLESDDALNHKKFYKQIIAAETKALKLPDISLFEQVSNIDTLFTLIQTGVVLRVAYDTGLLNSTASSITSFVNLISTVPFGK